MSTIERPPQEVVVSMVRAALEEDAARSDATVAFVGAGDEAVRAEIRAGENIVVAGIGVAREVFHQVDPAISFAPAVADGDCVVEDGVLVRLQGSARAVISAERTALNFLQRMSGVASHAARFVAAVAGTGVTILDTRKTIPLWRELDKYAVRCGGATNHRRDLHAMVLVKDNHVRAVGGQDAIISRIAVAPPAAFVELEVDSPEFLQRVLASDACERIDRVMLDNFTPQEVRSAVERVVAWRLAHPGSRLEIEVSGGITLETIRGYAAPQVDFISVGAITHSAPAASMSLEVL